MNQGVGFEPRFIPVGFAILKGSQGNPVFQEHCTQPITKLEEHST